MEQLHPEQVEVLHLVDDDAAVAGPRRLVADELHGEGEHVVEVAQAPRPQTRLVVEVDLTDRGEGAVAADAGPGEVQQRPCPRDVAAGVDAAVAQPAGRPTGAAR